MDTDIVVAYFVTTNTIDFLASLKAILFELFYADMNGACVESAAYALFYFFDDIMLFFA